MKISLAMMTKVFLSAAALSAAAFAATFLSCAKGEYEGDASGSFEATEVVVSAEASGRILGFDAEEGRTLKAGQEVGRIDSIQLELRRRQLLASKASVGSRRNDADLQLAAIAQQIDTARKERDRVRNLIAANAANQKQLDDIDAQIAALEKQERAQRTSIAQGNEGVSAEESSLDIQVAQLDDQIAKCGIRSPIDGTVLVKYAEPGEFASQGKALFKIADVGNMVLRAYVTSGQLSRLKLGQAATVLVDFGEKEVRQYPGRVEWISDKSEFTPKTAQTRDDRASLVYAIKVAVANDGYLKIGMYGKVRLGE
jgi:HlyD family secretion protein